MARLFGEVLKLCDRGGLVKAGVSAIDGTRLAGNASKDRNRGFERIAKEILAQAKATDEAEDQQHGDARGDELPEQLRTAEGRREFFRQVKHRRDDQRAIDQDTDEQLARSGETDSSQPPDNEAPQTDLPANEARDTDPPANEAPDADVPANEARDADMPANETPDDAAPDTDTAAKVGVDVGAVCGFEERTRAGREGWLREARRQLEARRWQEPQAIPRARLQRLVIAAERLEDELQAECDGNAAYEQYRANGRMKDGRRFGRPPNPYVPPQTPEGKVNITDPDSHYMKKTEGYVQGYNAQAVVTEGQIVLAAEITTSNADWSQLAPMVSAAIGELEQAGSNSRPQIAVADAQYWNEQHIDEVVANQHVQVLIPPESRGRDQPRPGWTGGRYDWMRTVLKADAGKQLYRKHPAMIEPVFGHTKHNRSATRFLRRGRSAVRTEWRSLMATHNLTKLYRHRMECVGA